MQERQGDREPDGQKNTWISIKIFKPFIIVLLVLVLGSVLVLVSSLLS